MQFPEDLRREFPNIIETYQACLVHPMENVEQIASKVTTLAFGAPHTLSKFPPQYFSMINFCQMLKEKAITKMTLFSKIRGHCGFMSDFHIERALAVLESFGKLIKFEEIVILNPSWLNTLFTMILTVIPNKADFVKDGILSHSEEFPWKQHIQGTGFTDKGVLDMLYHFGLGYPVYDATHSLIQSLIPASIHPLLFLTSLKRASNQP